MTKRDDMTNPTSAAPVAAEVPADTILALMDQAGARHGHTIKHTPEIVECFTAFAALLLEHAALAAQPAQPQLTVWFGPMPESNGRENWTVMLRRKTAPEGATGHDRHALLTGFTVCRSEYKDRMRYEADRLRFLLGEISEQPFILDYDANLHSGYKEPARPLSDELMDCVDRLGSEADTVDPRTWEHLLVYAPKTPDAVTLPRDVAERAALALHNAGVLCDAVPTRLQHNDCEQIARIGQLVNEQGIYGQVRDAYAELRAHGIPAPTGAAPTGAAHG